MEAERYEETTAKSDPDTAKLTALVALRQSALIALCIGISPEYASHFVKNVMEEGVPDGWCVGGKPPYAKTHLWNLAGTAWGANVGDSRLSRDDGRDGE